ncbi:MAG TPA: efflux RND transporter periplasmic adaptor subunit [Methylomirabilota bacterium]|nr:efflux RND transporter periplasmic adaptor subunit [Methylomirabilota bacterium]
MKRYVSLGLVTLAVAAGVWGYFYVQSGGNAPQYRLGRVERGPLTAAVSATGTLNAVKTVQVGSQVSGQIKELLADFNSVVRQGQIIARLDPVTFEAKVNQARAEVEGAHAAVLNQQAQVERARAEVENVRAAHAESRAQTARAQVALADARRDLERKTELFRRELIARSEQDTAQATFDSAEAALEAAHAKEQAGLASISSAQAQRRVADAQLKTAEAQVRQKQAALQQAQADLAHTIIRAPVDGVVVSRQVDVGQTVAASLQAPVLFTIAQDLTKMQVDTSVDEADIGRVTLDGPATFTVDAFPGETFAGRVTQIRKAPQVVQNVVTYIVVVAVDNPRGRLLPGMTANARLVVAEKAEALKVPNAALRFRPAGDSGDAAGSEPSVAEIRERLVKGLDLSAEQQARLDPILEEGRQRMLELRKEIRSPWAERWRTQRLRATTRARIREILTPEQQARYDALGTARRASTGRVFILGPDGKPKAVSIRLGITDGASTEVVSGDLQEGQDVVVGASGGAGAPGRPGGAPRLRL